MRALSLVCVGGLYAQIQRQLCPCLYFFCVKLADQLKEGPCAECVAVALGGCPEQLDQLARVGGGGEVWVAVEDEGGVGIVNRVVRDVARGRVAVGGLEVGCWLARLAGGRDGGEARRGIRRGGGSLRVAHVAIEAVGKMTGIVGLK